MGFIENYLKEAKSIIDLIIPSDIVKMIKIIKKAIIGIYISGENKTVEILNWTFLSITLSIPLPKAIATNIEGALPINVAKKYFFIDISNKIGRTFCTA